MMRVNKLMRLIKCVPLKVNTSHLDDTAMFTVVSKTAVTYQTTNTLPFGSSGLNPLDTWSVHQT